MPVPARRPEPRPAPGRRWHATDAAGHQADRRRGPDPDPDLEHPPGRQCRGVADGRAVAPRRLLQIRQNPFRPRRAGRLYRPARRPGPHGPQPGQEDRPQHRRPRPHPPGVRERRPRRRHQRRCHRSGSSRTPRHRPGEPEALTGRFRRHRPAAPHTAIHPRHPCPSPCRPHRYRRRRCRCRCHPATRRHPRRCR